VKKLWTALCAAVMVGMTILPAQAQDKTIKMGTLSWEDLTPISGITKKVLEDSGYTVKVSEFSEWGIAYAALSKGDIQILASQTDYVAHDYWNKNKNRLEKISPVSHGLFQGLAVPSYVTVDSIDQLNENAEKFGGKIIGIEPGSGLMRDTSMTAALKSAVDRKEWIVATVWEPSWMAQKFDVKFLKDPKAVFPPPQSYYWIGNKGFSAENPHAREVLASVYVPLADITSINAAVNDGKTMEQAVKDWTDSHTDLLKRWENIKKY
jgi:glycine betaine/proline transport system substrate-binding protein